MSEHRIEFVGQQSGDMECFCFEVDLETYRRLEKREPDYYDMCGRSDPFEPDGWKPDPSALYRYYPDFGEQKDKPIHVRIATSDEPIPEDAVAKLVTAARLAEPLLDEASKMAPCKPDCGCCLEIIKDRQEAFESIRAALAAFPDTTS